MKRKVFALLMAVCLLVGYLPTQVFAEDLPACHPKHDDTCKYVEKVEAQPCKHEHDDNCGYVAATDGVPCSCTDTNGDGSINHTDGCGYVAAVPEHCNHKHDSACGYQAAVEGHECEHSCSECQPGSLAQKAAEQDTCTCVTKCSEGSIDEACPVCKDNYAVCASTTGPAPAPAVSEAVQKVLDLLKELEGTYSAEGLTDEVMAQIEKVLADYDALSDEDKGQVAQERKTKLEALRNQIAPPTQDDTQDSTPPVGENVQTVNAKLKALPETVATPEELAAQAEAAAAAREAYDALTAEEKAQVDAALLARLTSLEALAALQARIDALPSQEELKALTTEQLNAIYNDNLLPIRAELDTLTSKEALNLSKLEAAEQFFTSLITPLPEVPEFEPVVPPSLPDNQDRVSQSKTATNLDENFKSRVTLSLPSAEEKLVSDVVFVLDKSTSASLEDQALSMLNKLKEQIAGNNAAVKVGVVIFNKVANVSGFYDLSTQYSNIEAAIKQKIESGTNTHAGLLAGKTMLDNDTSVDADRKYLIFVSDGITYMYNATPTVTAWTFLNDNTYSNWAGPENYESKYDSNNPPEDWMKFFADVGGQVKGQGTEFEYPYEGKVIKATPNDTEKNYANSVDKALYLTYQTYCDLAKSGYHCYAMTAESSGAEGNPWGPSFMNFLAKDETVDFESIQNDILYLVDNGSVVKDYIGYVEGDYNFDFVDGDGMILKVGEVSYNAVKLENNKYGFKPVGSDYAYTVEYIPGDKKGDEHFVWTINEPITNFAPVQLNYTVQLTNPKTADGKYGIYDSNGSNPNSTGLYTNTSATLSPKDSSGKPGDSIDFPKPTVSYEIFSINVEKHWDDSNNSDKIRPDSVTVRLYKNGNDTNETITLSEDNGWKGSFTGLRLMKGDKYTVSEEAVTGYTSKVSGDQATGFTITNTHVVPEPVNISVKKVWDDEENADGFRPDSVTVHLLANGKDTGKKLVLTAKKDWKGSFRDLDKFDSKGNLIEYTVKEDKVNKYNDPKYSGDAAKGFTITNTHELVTMEIPVKKVWKDSSDSRGKRPDEITIYLYADGKYTGTKLVISEDDDWKGVFEDLPKYKDGDQIKYSIKEKSISKYHARIKGSADDGFTVTNYYESSSMSAFTGDTSNIWLLTAIAVLSLAALVVIAVILKKKHK
ncbi:MAG: Cna B-type domain-containing protein [Eubacteriales bacterium]|nr:Cna B-type domain-containing protein [Eubacteriales bacterium]